MIFDESDMFKIVDSLFHMYASSYREDAKESLKSMIDRMNKDEIFDSEVLHIKP